MNNRRKPTYFRNSLDLKDKVQVKILRKRLKLSDEQFAGVIRKSGNSIAAITKEATRATSASPVEPAAVAVVVAV
jgi:DNA-binding transcriptional regulator YiaG